MCRSVFASVSEKSEEECVRVRVCFLSRGLVCIFIIEAAGDMRRVSGVRGERQSLPRLASSGGQAAVNQPTDEA